MITVLAGDITKVRVDAIVTLANPEGAWWSGVDGAIHRAANSLYHDQLRTVMLKSGLINGQVVVARGNSAQHLGSFDHVIFVVDDYYSPLADLISAGLFEAKKQGFKTIAIPLMRTGFILGVVGETLEAVLQQMSIALQNFLQEKGDDIQITVVVHNNPKAVELLSNSLMLLA